MNNILTNTELEKKIFSASPENFNAVALEVFRFQYQYNPVYKQYCDILKINVGNIDSIDQIPFLPIRFFKTHTITTTSFDPQAIFESSGTTETINSRHLIKDIELYKKSFNKCFEIFYGKPHDYCIIALLPSYLERNNSSLVMMADCLIKQNNHPLSGFYLDELEQLHDVLLKLEKQEQKTLLIGVTFALLDFSEQYPMPLKHTVIMETGGMKGRRKELTRTELQSVLCKAFSLDTIHSEYGMAELLSQAYSKESGIFNTPPWMKILLRDEDDPFTIHSTVNNDYKSGAINIIDLVNIYSCSFIATDDAVKLYHDGSFEILGRIDNSDIRGCSLLTV